MFDSLVHFFRCEWCGFVCWGCTICIRCAGTGPRALGAAAAAPPQPGPQMGNVSLVEAFVGVQGGGESGAALAVRALLVHFSGSLNATRTEDASIEICGLPTPEPSAAPVGGATVTSWVVDDAHSTFWAEWQKDLAWHSARGNSSTAWPAGVSRYDETAPAAVRGRPGWEWVAQEWPKYEALAALAPRSSRVGVAVSASGCTTLRETLAPHSVVLFEIQVDQIKSRA